jgi:undecaprenyl-diphosphatase
MELGNDEGMLARVRAADLSLCLFFNRAVHRRRVPRFFFAVSRLGDGIFWYTLMLLLPLLYGAEGMFVSLQMSVAGLFGHIGYKTIKTGVVRERPFVTHTIIQLGAKPLDRHSFPSGHTLHAVAFTAIVLGHYPFLALALVPFTVLVALSRMVLGLHYPSDVLTGAALGAAVA